MLEKLHLEERVMGSLTGRIPSSVSKDVSTFLKTDVGEDLEVLSSKFPKRGYIDLRTVESRNVSMILSNHDIGGRRYAQIELVPVLVLRGGQ